MNKKIVNEIMDMKNISSEVGEEATNITEMIDLQEDPLPDVFLKLLAENEEDEQNG